MKCGNCGAEGAREIKPGLYSCRACLELVFLNLEKEGFLERAGERLDENGTMQIVWRRRIEPQGPS